MCEGSEGDEPHEVACLWIRGLIQIKFDSNQFVSLCLSKVDRFVGHSWFVNLGIAIQPDVEFRGKRISPDSGRGGGSAERRGIPRVLESRIDSEPRLPAVSGGSPFRAGGAVRRELLVEETLLLQNGANPLAGPVAQRGVCACRCMGIPGSSAEAACVGERSVV